MRVLAIISLMVTTTVAQAAEAWAPGVSLDDGWVDYNKTAINAGYMADTNMCWAYSASNVITWWQNQNADTLTSSGVTVPQNEQIVKTFVGVFSNVGGVPSDGYSWYINGGDDNKLNATETGKVTISVGVATYPDHAQNAQDLIEQADKGLYYAKEHGRNQVKCIQE